MPRKYRPFPKKKDGIYWRLDRERIREMFLSQNEYTWTKFCENAGFNPITHKDFPVRVWQQEWLQQQTEIVSDEFVVPALELKRNVIRERLGYVKEWGEMSQALKSILHHKAYLLQVDIKHDQVHSSEIADGTIKPKFNLKPSDLSFMATAAKQIMEIHRESLLMPASEIKNAIPLKEVDPVVAQSEAEGDRLGSLGALNMDGSPVTRDQMTQLLGTWIDQQAKPVEISDQEPTPEIPIDPFEGEE